MQISEWRRVHGTTKYVKTILEQYRTIIEQTLRLFHALGIYNVKEKCKILNHVRVKRQHWKIFYGAFDFHIRHV